MSKGMNLIAMHRQVQRREFAEACKELDSLKLMLRQRDMILYAVLKRVGPQTVTQDDMETVPADMAVKCTPIAGEAAMVFSAVGVEAETKEDENATETGTEGDQPKHQGNGEGAETRQDGSQDGREKGA